MTNGEIFWYSDIWQQSHCHHRPHLPRQPSQDTEISSHCFACDNPLAPFLLAGDRAELSSWAWLFFTSASLFPRLLYKSIYSCSPTYLNSCLFLMTSPTPIPITFFFFFPYNFLFGIKTAKNIAQIQILVIALGLNHGVIFSALYLGRSPSQSNWGSGQD